MPPQNLKFLDTFPSSVKNSRVANIEVIQADITKIGVQAIVNAANKTLLGGGGVDGAIHRKAGPELKKECAKLKGCRTGEAKLTLGYNLHSDYVIHTVGPVWSGGQKNEPALLEQCYLNSLKIARDKGIKSIAFPSISTGVYRFPFEEAATIAVKSVQSFCSKESLPEHVIFCCFSAGDALSYRRLLRNG